MAIILLEQEGKKRRVVARKLSTVAALRRALEMAIAQRANVYLVTTNEGRGLMKYGPRGDVAPLSFNLLYREED